MIKKKIYTLTGFILLIAIWQLVSLIMPSVVIASPSATMKAFLKLAVSEYFWSNFLISFQRIFAGVLWGGIAGFIIGVSAGLNKPLKYMLEPLRWTLISVPAVVIVVVAMLWFGMGTRMVIFITGVMLSPVVYINTIKGFESIDEKLIEMANIYRLPLAVRIRHLYVPAITGPLVSAFVIIAGTGVRIVVLAEVLGASEGIGYALAVTRSNLEVPEMFSWVILCILIVAAIENIVLKPFQSMAERWQA
jgi:NitT/TauT family transport system permease protein